MKDATYIRVGATYYKLVRVPTIAGQFNEIIVPWTLETIRQDHGRNFIGSIKKFDGFTCLPSHLNFKQEWHGFYNIYAPLPHNFGKAIFLLL